MLPRAIQLVLGQVQADSAPPPWYLLRLHLFLGHSSFSAFFGEWRACPVLSVAMVAEPFDKSIHSRVHTVSH